MPPGPGPHSRPGTDQVLAQSWSWSRLGPGPDTDSIDSDLIELCGAHQLFPLTSQFCSSVDRNNDSFKKSAADWADYISQNALVVVYDCPEP